MGLENGKRLEDWWLAVHKSEVDKLMITASFVEADAPEALASFLEDEEYLAIRQAAIELTFPPPKTDEK